MMWKDFLYSLRLLFRSPGFTLSAVVILALGIGANTAIFSIINTAVLKPLPFADADRLVMVWTQNPERGWDKFPSSLPDFLDWQQSGIFEQLGAFRAQGFNARFADRTERVDGVLGTQGFFAAFKVTPQIGRSVSDEDALEGHQPVVLLSHQMWRAHYNADTKVLGKILILDGVPHTIIGVFPEKLPTLGQEQIYVPMAAPRLTAADRGKRSVAVLGRLRNGITLIDAQKRMAKLAERLDAQYYEYNAGNTVLLQPFSEAVVEDARALLLILLGIVVFVLLIACANLANLTLLRGTSRLKEIAVRAAMGATRTALVRQLLIEKVVISLLAGGFGMLPAFWGMRAIAASGLLDLPHPEELHVDVNVLLFTVILSVGTGVFFGIVPALQISAVELNETLKSSAGQGARRGSHWFRNVFVVSQVALTMVLVVGAGLLLKSFARLRNANPGYNPHSVLTCRISLSEEQFPDPGKRVAFFSRVIASLQAIPKVRAVAAVDYLPTSTDVHASGLFLVGHPAPRPQDVPLVVTASISPAYFAAMQIPLRRGRFTQESDQQGSPLVAVVDEWVARHYWPDQSPLGQRIKLGKDEPEREIVGVVGEVRRPAVEGKLRGQIYLPYGQTGPRTMSLALRVSGDPESLETVVRNTVREVDIDQPVFQMGQLDQARAANMVTQRVVTALLSCFAGVALLLATLGIYGVVASSVNQRRKEIGIRMALGADRSDVLYLVMTQGFGFLGIGLLLGLCAAYLLTRGLKALLFDTPPSDPLTFILAALLIGMVGAIATFIPARRAMAIDPGRALRYE
jgi:putative ABC transport system permease protein